jgi:hypothetical protein
LGVAFIQDKYNSGILNSYFNMMDTVSSGYYTILNIENRNMPTEFCELIYKNIHYDYHISNEYLDGDDQLSNDSGDDSEFTQVKSKFVYE